MEIINESTRETSLLERLGEFSDLPELRLLTYSELTKRMGVSRKTIDQWRENWGFPYLQEGEDCQIYFPVGAIQQWIENRVDEQHSTDRGQKRDELLGEIEDQTILQ